MFRNSSQEDLLVKISRLRGDTNEEKPQQTIDITEFDPFAEDISSLSVQPSETQQHHEALAHTASTLSANPMPTHPMNQTDVEKLNAIIKKPIVNKYLKEFKSAKQGTLAFNKREKPTPQQSHVIVISASEVKPIAYGIERPATSKARSKSVVMNTQLGTTFGATNSQQAVITGMLSAKGEAALGNNSKQHDHDAFDLSQTPETEPSRQQVTLLQYAAMKDIGETGGIMEQKEEVSEEEVETEVREAERKGGQEENNESGASESEVSESEEDGDDGDDGEEVKEAEKDNEELQVLRELEDLNAENAENEVNNEYKEEIAGTRLKKRKSNLLLDEASDSEGDESEDSGIHDMELPVSLLSTYSDATTAIEEPTAGLPALQREAELSISTPVPTVMPPLQDARFSSLLDRIKQRGQTVLGESKASVSTKTNVSKPFPEAATKFPSSSNKSRTAVATKSSGKNACNSMGPLANLFSKISAQNASKAADSRTRHALGNRSKVLMQVAAKKLNLPPVFSSRPVVTADADEDDDDDVVFDFIQPLLPSAQKLDLSISFDIYAHERRGKGKLVREPTKENNAITAISSGNSMLQRTESIGETTAGSIAADGAPDSDVGASSMQLGSGAEVSAKKSGLRQPEASQQEDPDWGFGESERRELFEVGSVSDSNSQELLPIGESGFSLELNESQATVVEEAVADDLLETLLAESEAGRLDGALSNALIIKAKAVSMQNKSEQKISDLSVAMDTDEADTRIAIETKSLALPKAALCQVAMVPDIFIEERFMAVGELYTGLDRSSRSSAITDSTSMETVCSHAAIEPHESVGSEIFASASQPSFSFSEVADADWELAALSMLTQLESSSASPSLALVPATPKQSFLIPTASSPPPSSTAGSFSTATTPTNTPRNAFPALPSASTQAINTTTTLLTTSEVLPEYTVVSAALQSPEPKLTRQRFGATIAGCGGSKNSDATFQSSPSASDSTDLSSPEPLSAAGVDRGLTDTPSPTPEVSRPNRFFEMDAEDEELEGGKKTIEEEEEEAENMLETELGEMLDNEEVEDDGERQAELTRDRDLQEEAADLKALHARFVQPHNRRSRLPDSIQNIADSEDSQNIGIAVSETEPKNRRKKQSDIDRSLLESLDALTYQHKESSDDEEKDEETLRRNQDRVRLLYFNNSDSMSRSGLEVDSHSQQTLSKVRRQHPRQLLTRTNSGGGVSFAAFNETLQATKLQRQHSFLSSIGDKERDRIQSVVSGTVKQAANSKQGLKKTAYFTSDNSKSRDSFPAATNSKGAAPPTLQRSASLPGNTQQPEHVSGSTKDTRKRKHPTTVKSGKDKEKSLSAPSATSAIFVAMAMNRFKKMNNSIV